MYGRFIRNITQPLITRADTVDLAALCHDSPPLNCWKSVPVREAAGTDVQPHHCCWHLYADLL